MNRLQVIQTFRIRRNKTFKDTKIFKEEKKGLNIQINEEDGIDHVINEDDDRNLNNIDNPINFPVLIARTTGSSGGRQQG